MKVQQIQIVKKIVQEKSKMIKKGKRQKLFQMVGLTKLRYHFYGLAA